MKPILACVLLLASLPLAAQASLSPQATLPEADGSLTNGEYQFSQTFRRVTLNASLGEDNNIYLAISTPTTGWAAIGTNSLRMDGARIYMAIGGEKPLLSVQAGSGNTHRDAAGDPRIKWAAKTSAAGTIFELVLPREVAADGNALNLIWAYSKTTNLRVRHDDRGSLTLELKP